VIEVPYMVHNSYTDGLNEIAKFFRGGPAPVDMEDTLEVMNMLDAAARSAKSGKEEKLTKI
jgi:predicted dehydrogenase